MNLKKKTVFITGGRSGLGKCLAELMSAKGAVVHVCGKSAKGGSEDKNIQVHQCDVRDFDKLQTLIDSIGNIVILINAAGVWLEGDLNKYTQDQIDYVLDTNLKGLIYASKISLPVMLKSKEGVIVNIASSAGFKEKPNETVYAASKWGVRGFTDSLREMVKGEGVRVVGVYPGGMATPFFEKGGNPKDNQSWMDPKEVAKTIVYAVENDNTLTLDNLHINRN